MSTCIGGGGSEYVDALARVSGVQPGSEGSQEGRTASFDETSKLDQALDALSKKATNTINLKQEDVTNLQKSEAAHTRKRTDSRGSISGSHKLKSSAKGSKEQDKDCVLFTCGHHFTRKEFLVCWCIVVPAVLYFYSHQTCLAKFCFEPEIKHFIKFDERL